MMRFTFPKDHSDGCEKKGLEGRPVRSLVIVQTRDDGDLMKKGHVWDWGSNQQAAFEKAKY